MTVNNKQISSAKTVTVKSITVSHHKLNNNGKKEKFSVTTSDFAIGNVLDVDSVVKKASILSNGKNFVESHKLLAKYTIESPLNIYANESKYSYKSTTSIDISYE